jgi:hypothetical protein
MRPKQGQSVLGERSFAEGQRRCSPQVRVWGAFPGGTKTPAPFPLSPPCARDSVSPIRQRVSCRVRHAPERGVAPYVPGHTRYAFRVARLRKAVLT